MAGYVLKKNKENGNALTFFVHSPSDHPGIGYWRLGKKSDKG
jgi:hypothetical protein